MIDLIVFRGAGDREGEDVLDVLLSDTSAALQRGKYEIDFNTPKVRRSVSVAYAGDLKLGDVVSIVDTKEGRVAFGIVKEYTHVREGVSVYTTVLVESAQ